MVFPMKCSDVHLAYRTGCLPILVICVLNGHLNLHGSTKQLREKSLVKVNKFVSQSIALCNVVVVSFCFYCWTLLALNITIMLLVPVPLA